MLDSRKQRTNRMTCGSGAKIFCRHVQINLRAGDLSMTEQIPNRHKTHAGAHQVGRKSMAHPMW